MSLQHSRILQVHFDRSELIVYKSELYNFKNKETAPIELFFQYLMNTPHRKTTSLPIPLLKAPE